MYYNNDYKAFEINRRGFVAIFRDVPLPTDEERQEWAKICSQPIKLPYFILADGNYRGKLYATDDAEAVKMFELII